MRFSVDPWDPTYGTSLDTELGQSTRQVDADLEVPTAQWAPIDPPARGVEPEVVLFVDGVRRVDAQVWVDGAEVSAALCASYAAGVVCCCRAHGAHLLDSEVRRGLVTTSPEAADIDTWAGTYGVTLAAARPEVAPMQVLSQALQRALGEVELTVAERARSTADHTPDPLLADPLLADPLPADLLVLDGPLRGRQHLPRTIGFVKSHRSDYLPPALGGVVAALRAGQRTPVFGLGTSWERHTWYLRLPCPPGTPWAGIVRVEAPVGPASVALATLSQTTLPRYASTEYKDSRAPQNLYPIAGLERALRRRLGEPALLYRALRRAAAVEPAPTPLG